MTIIENEFGACKVYECDSLKHEVINGFCEYHRQEAQKAENELTEKTIVAVSGLGLPEDEAMRILEDIK